MPKPQSKIYRILEMIPGTVVWGSLIISILLSFIKPLWVIYFIIMYSVLWLFRVLYFVFYIFLGFYKHKKAMATDWLGMLQKEKKSWQDLYHVVMLPTAGESVEVIKTTFDGLLTTDYPKDNMIVLLAGEERKGKQFKEVADEILKTYTGKFHKILITVHPDNQPGELKGKGANARYAAIEAKKYLDLENIPYEKVILSYFDSDTAVHPKYFSCLTYKYVTNPEPTRSSYQPAVLYNNNMWDASAVTRVAAFGTVFWLMTELARPDRMFTFSSHSMSFKMLVDVDFFEKDVVSDDSRIYLQGFIQYDGNYSVVPMYVPVSMDTVMAENFWQTMKNLYLQQRRWAWGCENIPYLIWHCFFVPNKIKLRYKIKHVFNQIEGMFSWVTAPIFLLVLGRLPLWTIQGKSAETVIAQNAPFILEDLMMAAMIGIFVSAIVSLMLLPPRPDRYHPFRFFIMILQWAMLPVTLLLFGSFPALEAQTRLMFGKYLGFWVTEKSRK